MSIHRIIINRPQQTFDQRTPPAKLLANFKLTSVVVYMYASHIGTHITSSAGM